jgi:hypothetical protein
MGLSKKLLTLRDRRRGRQGEQAARHEFVGPAQTTDDPHRSGRKGQLHVMSAGGDLETAMRRVAPEIKQADPDFIVNFDTAVGAMKQIPLGTLEELKGYPEVIKKIEKSLRHTLSQKGSRVARASLCHNPSSERVARQIRDRSACRHTTDRERNGAYDRTSPYAGIHNCRTAVFLSAV